MMKFSFDIGYSLLDILRFKNQHSSSKGLQKQEMRSQRICVRIYSSPGQPFCQAFTQGEQGKRGRQSPSFRYDRTIAHI
jgi:hypothetical protein